MMLQKWMITVLSEWSHSIYLHKVVDVVSWLLVYNNCEHIANQGLLGLISPNFFNAQFGSVLCGYGEEEKQFIVQ